MERSDQTSVSLFRRSTIRVRLVAVFCFVALLLVLLAAVSTWQLAQLERASETGLRSQRLIGKWLAQSQGNVIRTLVLARTDDAAVRQLLAPELAAGTQRVTALQAQVEGLLATPGSKALFEEAVARRKNYLEIRQRMLDRKQAGQGAEALALLDSSLVPATSAYLGSVESLLDLYGGESAAALDLFAERLGVLRRLATGLPATPPTVLEGKP